MPGGKISNFLAALLFSCKALLLVDSTWPLCDVLEFPPNYWKIVVGFVLRAKLQSIVFSSAVHRFFLEAQNFTVFFLQKTT